MESATHQILRLELGPMSPRFQGMGTQTSPRPKNKITCRVPLACSYYPNKQALPKEAET